ncbi:cysteine desulfurase [Neptunitalea chrysea]|uniref:Cysteine desulfurase n=1 Tax=Neptunitalea chrysea TaxID=1647581 RepID=A0A9W6B7H6_9FLAO|nr:cysteine desulfurase family protein [Neptunitalea chrysea]GLB53237.1 cysteine desulfurase [Neptunitalea chrysea]
MKKVYLDNAATTKVDAEVIQKMSQVLTDFYGNPSSTHSFGKSAKTMVEKARKSISKCIGADTTEIIFTSGGTEANNMILRSAVRDLKVEVIITSNIEHHAVLNTVLQLQSDYGIEVLYVDLDTNGNVDLTKFERLLGENEERKVLVSLMHVNNEIGNILPIEKVGLLCKAYGVYFHSDTVQSITHFSFDLQHMNVDFLTASAHKFHGPKGVGFTYIKKGLGIKPLLFGGEQERGLRAGTEAVHNIIGLETAFVKAVSTSDTTEEQLTFIKQYFMNRLTEHFSGVTFNGNSGVIENSVNTILNVCFPFSAEKGKLLLFHLDLLGGIACSAGSACQSGSNKPSHVLTAILSEDDLAKPSIRFSFSKETTTEDIDYTVQKLIDFDKK